MIVEKDQHLVYFPRNFSSCQQNYRLILDNEATNKIYVFDNLIDQSNTKLYYLFYLDFSDMPEGEYKYKIDNMAKGLLRIGHVKNEYTSNVNEDEIIIYRD